MSDKNDFTSCPCFENPLGSKCGEWDGNVSLCLCADDGLAVQTGDVAPS